MSARMRYYPAGSKPKSKPKSKSKSNPKKETAKQFSDRIKKLVKPSKYSLKTPQEEEEDKLSFTEKLAKRQLEKLEKEKKEALKPKIVLSKAEKKNKEIEVENKKLENEIGLLEFEKLQLTSINKSKKSLKQLGITQETLKKKIENLQKTIDNKKKQIDENVNKISEIQKESKNIQTGKNIKEWVDLIQKLWLEHPNLIDETKDGKKTQDYILRGLSGYPETEYLRLKKLIEAEKILGKKIDGDNRFTSDNILLKPTSDLYRIDRVIKQFLQEQSIPKTDIEKAVAKVEKKRVKKLLKEREGQYKEAVREQEFALMNPTEYVEKMKAIEDGLEYKNNLEEIKDELNEFKRGYETKEISKQFYYDISKLYTARIKVLEHRAKLKESAMGKIKESLKQKKFKKDIELLKKIKSDAKDKEEKDKLDEAIRNAEKLERAEALRLAKKYKDVAKEVYVEESKKEAKESVIAKMKEIGKKSLEAKKEAEELAKKEPKKEAKEDVKEAKKEPPNLTKKQSIMDYLEMKGHPNDYKLEDLKARYQISLKPKESPKKDEFKTPSTSPEKAPEPKAPEPKAPEPKAPEGATGYSFDVNNENAIYKAWQNKEISVEEHDKLREALLAKQAPRKSTLTPLSSEDLAKLKPTEAMGIVINPEAWKIYDENTMKEIHKKSTDPNSFEVTKKDVLKTEIGQGLYPKKQHEKAMSMIKQHYSNPKLQGFIYGLSQHKRNPKKSLVSRVNHAIKTIKKGKIRGGKLHIKF